MAKTNDGFSRPTMSQLEAELKQLTENGETVLYRRIQIASTLVKDGDWLTNHKGSLDAAEAYLQGTYFRDLTGFIDLMKLIAMHDKIPELKWKECRYDLAAIESIYDETHLQPSEGMPRKTKSWKKEATLLADKLEKANAQIGTSSKLETANEREIASLRQEVKRLSEENALLRGRLMEIEKRLQPVAA